MSAEGFRLHLQSWSILFLISTSLFTALGCSSAPSRKADGVWKPTAGELYFSDGNRAPASMSPPQPEGTESTVIDSAHIQSQSDYHFALAEAYSLEGEVQRAIEEYKLTLLYDPNSSLVHVKLGSEYVKKGLLSEAVKHAEQAVALDANHFEARFLLGGLYSSMKLYEPAKTQYKAVVERDPQNTEAYLYLGALQAEENQYEDAIQTFKKVAALKSNTSPHLAHYYIGRIQIETKQLALAKGSFETALSLKPDFVDGVIALGGILDKSGQADKAKKLYESFQDRFGPHERIAEVLAKMFLEAEDFDEAYNQYEIVSIKDPQNLNAKVKMALILIEKKEYARAVERLKDVIALAPEADKIRFYLGAVYEEMRDYSSAIEQFSRLPITSSFYEEAVLHTAYLYKLRDEYDKALEVIEAGAKNRPDVPQFYALWASLLDDQKKYDVALNMLKTAVQKFPKSDQLWFFLGSIQDKVGDKASMVTCMQTVIEINPDHAQALNYLAYSFAESGRDLDNALTMAEKAMGLKPGDPYIMDTYGWVLYRLGRYSEAVKTLELAHRQKPDESIIAEHLGDAYYQVQAPQQARQMYERAFASEKDDGNRDKLRAKIDSIASVPPVSPAPGTRIPASAGSR